MTDTEQVPRDAAFWATFSAVQRELDQTAARGECLTNGHSIWMGGGLDGEDGCERCDASREDALWDDGFAPAGRRWVQVGPFRHGDIETRKDGAQITFRHVQSGVEVSTNPDGTWPDDRPVVARYLAMQIARQQEIARIPKLEQELAELRALEAEES